MNSIEKWVDVPEYKGIYQINNFGKIKNIKRGNYITANDNGRGYLYVKLSKNKKQIDKAVHRLVAKAFLPNPNNLPEVNHKDENKTNNFVFINPDGGVNPEKSNLEWCDRSYNINYGSRIKKWLSKISKPVLQYSLKGDYIQEWISAREIERETGRDSSSISKCCLGKYKTAYGYVWKFKDS